MHVLKQLLPHHALEAVAASEPRDAAVSMLPDAGAPVGRDPDVEGSQTLTGEDVDARLFHWRE